MIKMIGVVKTSLNLYRGCSFMSMFRRVIHLESAKQAERDDIERRGGTTYVESQVFGCIRDWKYYQEVPSKIQDFKVELNGCKVTLLKSLPGETIMVRFNINHSMMMHDDYWSDSENENGYATGLSIPDFKVYIEKGDATLAFRCSFLGNFFSGDEEIKKPSDSFRIDGLALYKGKWKKNNHAIRAYTLNRHVYNLLLKFLNGKGITNEFLDNVCTWSTQYNYHKYIRFSTELKDFMSDYLIYLKAKSKFKE